jgi:arginyl-tRNA synthetase
MNIRQLLEQRVSAALAQAGAAAPSPALVTAAGKAQFGDYQANGVMAAAKKAKANPHELAKAVKAVLDGTLADLAARVEVAGPGFLNITLRDDFLAAGLARQAGDERLGVQPPQQPQTVVVDYSAPNLAKEMHVGHLRSTIIGDALARILEFAGQRVIRQNHVGDWGTQFGMLIAYMHRAGAGSGELADLEEFYKKAKKLFDEAPSFADEARGFVVRLQGGDAAVLRQWKAFLDESMNHCRQVYARLGVQLTDADIRGESAYNDDLPNVVADLRAKGMLTESQGALCVFLPGFEGKDGPLPLIIQKRDEGYLYATTDLAAIRYRVRTLGADRILYVVDARQAPHFKYVFAVAGAAGFLPKHVHAEHIGFGVMMGKDRKPFRTRQGGTVKLMELLDEAQSRAFELVSAKSPELDEPARREIARVVGVGAVKYADLLQNRTTDYIFEWDKLISLDGNTAPYMQYAYARVRSIFRKGVERGAIAAGAAAAEFSLAEPSERALAMKLLQWPEVLDSVACECMPNLLCAYLYELAGAFMGFYEACPVLQSQEPLRSSRLRLCELTARTIKTGLGLLGIEVIEQM